MIIIRDAHIHSPYCPHGTSDSLRAYVKKAMAAGLTDITFTEHAPLPEGFTDPVPDRDSAMLQSDLFPYLEAVKTVKKEYAEKINIRVGLEVDYIEGFEHETKKLLDIAGPHLDDAILSVHFLKTEDGYFCLDYHEDTFGNLVHTAGSLENVYKLYYQTVLHSIEADLGSYKPDRIGHMTLVHKFQHQFPRTFHESSYIEDVLNKIQASGMSLDVNTAGLFKKNCQEHYPPAAVLQLAKQKGIPFVFGSDAHESAHVGAGREEVAHFF